MDINWYTHNEQLGCIYGKMFIWILTNWDDQAIQLEVVELDTLDLSSSSRTMHNLVQVQPVH